jgi:hypothetical protein
MGEDLRGRRGGAATRQKKYYTTPVSHIRSAALHTTIDLRNEFIFLFGDGVTRKKK